MAARNYLLLLLLCLDLYVIATGQMMPPGQKKISASKADLPYVECSVCQKAVKHIKDEVKKMRTNSLKKTTEDEILSVVEKSCDPDSKHGDWISRYDIIESNGILQVFEQELHSKCKQECKTIAKACEESVGDIDTDLGELLWKNELTLSQLINKVCYDLSNVCSKKQPKYVKGKRKDEVFVPMSEEEKKAFDMMKSMKSMPGMPGMEMYSKDDIANMQQQQQQQQQHQQQYREPQNSDEVPGKEEIQPGIPQSTSLGLMETVKVTFQGLFSRVKNIFGFGQRKSEL